MLLERVEHQAWANSFHHGHNYHLITAVFFFQNGLVEMLDIVLQALPILLVDCEEVGSILFPNPVAHEIGDKEPT